MSEGQDMHGSTRETNCIQVIFCQGGGVGESAKSPRKGSSEAVSRSKDKVGATEVWELV